MESLKAKLRIVAITLISALLLTGCNANLEQIEQLLEAMSENATEVPVNVSIETAQDDTSAADEVPVGTKESGDDEDEDEPSAPDKDIYILFTSDVHCGIDQGFGYAGLEQIKKQLEAKGYDVLLVDNGDFAQGEAVGTLTDGEAIIPIMNALKYDVVIPGNHDFDYGMDQFFKFVDQAEFPFISCNFNKNGKLVFDPYIIKEAGGKKIAFVGVTTPETLTDVAKTVFEDENGNLVYGFMQGNGEELYRAVQSAVDAARADGADFVYAMAHLGNDMSAAPYDYMDVIANTTGIDVFLDGHSHDTDQVVMKNKDGKEVTRSACGTKLNCIGYSHIYADDDEDEAEIDTNIWEWENDMSIPALLGITNDIGDLVAKTNEEIDEKLGEVVARTDVDLTINDPEAKTDKGAPIRIVRSQETNLGDIVADAYRVRTGADIAVVNGGGVRAAIQKGDITYKQILDVHPFGNKILMIEVTGQQLADALEWSCRKLPDEEGGFLQVSGISFDVDTKIDSPCIADVNGDMEKIEGKRRVSNIKVGKDDLDPKATYSLAGCSYILTEKGNGYTAFDNARILIPDAGLDNQILIDYITETLGGTVGDDYADPYGQGRIVIN